MTFNFSPATCLLSGLAVLDLEDGYLDVGDRGNLSGSWERWGLGKLVRWVILEGSSGRPQRFVAQGCLVEQIAAIELAVTDLSAAVLP